MNIREYAIHLIMTGMGVSVIIGCVVMDKSIRKYSHIIDKETWVCTDQRLTKVEHPQENECIKYELKEKL